MPYNSEECVSISTSVLVNVFTFISMRHCSCATSSPLHMPMKLSWGGIDGECNFLFDKMSRSKRMGRCVSLLETSNTLLRQKLEKARASAHMPQEDDTNSSLTSTPRSGGAVSEEMSRSMLQSHASPPDMQTGERSMSVRSVLQE